MAALRILFYFPAVHVCVSLSLRFVMAERKMVVRFVLAVFPQTFTDFYEKNPADLK